MNRKTMSIPALIAVGLCLGSATTSSAQHAHGAPKHRPKVHVNLVTPQGRPVTQHHDHFRYVVPPATRLGAFYTFENAYYYTPPIPRGVGQPQTAQRPVTMEFGASKHLVELAERLEFLANELCLDLHHNYRHNPRFNEVYGEAYQLLQAGKFIHNREHQGDRQAIRRSVTDIDNLFHHVQEELSGLERQENRQIGHLGFEAKTEELQALIHHLMYDQGVKPAHDQERQPNPAASAAREEAPSPSP